MVEVYESGRLYDVLTGERMERGERIIDTGIRSVSFRPVNLRPTLFIKEATLVRLMEAAGYDVAKRDAGNLGNAESVDATDVGVGSGEASVGEDSVGGSTTSKRRSTRKTKG